MKPILNSKGFTLVEILMSLVVLGVLLAAGISQFIDLNKEARTAVTRERLNALKMAISGDARLVAGGIASSPGYETHMNRIPTALTELTTQGAQATYNPHTKLGWRGPYVDSNNADWNKDAWGTTFTYTSATRTIQSCGPDTACGNADDISVVF